MYLGSPNINTKGHHNQLSINQLIGQTHLSYILWHLTLTFYSIPLCVILHSFPWHEKDTIVGLPTLGQTQGALALIGISPRQAFVNLSQRNRVVQFPQTVLQGSPLWVTREGLVWRHVLVSNTLFGNFTRDWQSIGSLLLRRARHQEFAIYTVSYVFLI